MITDNNEQNCNDSKSPCKKCVFLRGTSILQWIKNKYIWLVFCGIILLFFIWGFTGTLSDGQKNRYEVLSVLFSGLAFAAVIITIRTQSNQFQEELRARKKEEIYSVINSISENVKNITSEIELINKISYSTYISYNEISLKKLKERIKCLSQKKNPELKILTGSLFIKEILYITESHLNLLEFIHENKNTISKDEDMLFLLEIAKNSTEILLASYQNLLPLTSGFVYCCHLLNESKNILNKDDIENLYSYLYTSRTHEEIKILMITTEIGVNNQKQKNDFIARLSASREDNNCIYGKYHSNVLNTFLTILRHSIHPEKNIGMLCKTLNEGLDLQWPLICKDENHEIIS